MVASSVAPTTVSRSGDPMRSFRERVHVDDRRLSAVVEVVVESAPKRSPARRRFIKNILTILSSQDQYKESDVQDPFQLTEVSTMDIIYTGLRGEPWHAGWT
jgi:hypothetical protein